jgi:tRNA pseudouridine55 synthase
MLALKLNKEKIERILADETSRIFLIDKPKGLHSFNIVYRVRRILNLKKVGFSGTLDPLASGLMIVASGQATKLLDLFHNLSKEYEADIIFGQTSSSFDLEQAVVINESAQEFTKEKFSQAINKFVGEQMQQVPIYSAVKVQGQKLHEMARRGQVVIAPKKKVNIFKIDILEFSYPTAKILVSCSAGTYIRSLVSDLGSELGTGAILSDLRRTAIGEYKIEKAAKVDGLDKDKLLASQVAESQLRGHLDEYHV